MYNHVTNPRRCSSIDQYACLPFPDCHLSILLGGHSPVIFKLIWSKVHLNFTKYTRSFWSNMPCKAKAFQEKVLGY